MFRAGPAGLSLSQNLRLFIGQAAPHSTHRPLRPGAQFRAFSNTTRPSARTLGRYAIYSVPVVGGLALYFTPHPTPLSQTICTAPHVIPCHNDNKNRSISSSALLHSPAEPYYQEHLHARILHFLKTKILEPIFIARRFFYLLIIFVPVVLSSPMLLVGAPEAKYGGDRWGAVWWYGMLVQQMQRAGPTFIKLAQWAGSRADLFPSILCDRLGALHSQGKPHSFRHTKYVVERVFGRPFDEVFEEFDPKPIGTGAIAQVYRATLRKDLLPPSYLGPKRGGSARAPMPYALPSSAPSASVAVKILHPRVNANISRDLSIMRFFAKCLNVFPGMQWLSLPEEVEVFGTMMNEQLDLRNEATNLKRFEENFKGRRAAVSFPRPLTDWTTRDILIEEFEDAVPLEPFLHNGGGPYDDMLAEIGLDAFLNMLLLDNFVHSDLHPGNIMVKFYKPDTKSILKGIWASLFSSADEQEFQPAPNADAATARLRPLKHSPEKWKDELQALFDEGYHPELVFIDTGLVTTLDANSRRNFLDLFAAIASFDGYRAGTLMVERCRTPELARDPETFALKIQHLVLNVKSKTFSLGQIRIAEVLTAVLRAVRVHHVKMEADFINTVLSILLLEGIGRQLDPSLDLFRASLPILRQLGREMSSTDLSGLSSNLGPMLKLWVWAEAREFASAAMVDTDKLIRYDLLCPNV
ncbi:ABC1-domain-containing protein [Sistotremastrum niveocremeum HHB9708]|uniref:ABC1-domain-containing protein n=1 Tax=Sistotremastrum niveocremeum HHB9708 TaxID=1314777 RepID=A0A164XKM7_9AGAM|nr:ABC1-domain-containing protein [Sistotremastrum niveocremeum HHB9708]